MYNIVIYITVKMNTEHHYLVVIISVTGTGICYDNHWTKYSDVHAVCNIVIIGIVGLIWAHRGKCPPIPLFASPDFVLRSKPIYKRVPKHCE